MNRTAFAIVFAVSTFVFGAFASFFLPFPNGPWINLVWGVVDGLGPYALDKILPGTSMLTGPIPTAVILWPLVVAILAFLIIRFGFRAERIGPSHPAALFLVVSLLICVPYKSIDGALKTNDPTWLSYYYAGY